MKKPIILILFLFGILAIPAAVFADVRGPQECCILDHDLSDIDGLCVLSAIVGPLEGAKWCDPDEDGFADVPLPCRRWATCCFVDSIYSVSDWLSTAFATVAVVVFLIAAFFFLFSGGDPGRISKSKSLFLYGVIAIVLFVLAKVIPATIKAMVA